MKQKLPEAADGRMFGPAAQLQRHGALVLLPDREKEIVSPVAKGCSNKEMTGQLMISVKTVETHKSRGMEQSAV